MITSITFILDPPLGRYSSGTCVRLLARVPHPAAPGVGPPAAPAPATLRKSLRVRVRLIPRLQARTAKQRPQAPPGMRTGRVRAEQSVSWCPSKRASLIPSNQPPKIVANSDSLRRVSRVGSLTRAGAQVGLMYARQTTIGKDGYAPIHARLYVYPLPEAVLLNWLITGGCGFIGTALVRSLMEEGGHAVRVVDNLTVGTREDLAAASEFVEVPSEEPGTI